MRLRLVLPAWPEIAGRRRMHSLFPPLNLGIVAALTPHDWDIEIVDESVEELVIDRNADLVGISALTAVAPRAYEIAGKYRELGVKVVLGGVHPSLAPREALQHADAVVVGEAEGAWERLVTDFQSGELAHIYQREITDREEISVPIPRRDLFKKDAYLTINTVHTSRGCPHACDFCTVSRLFGRRHRTRPISEVISEVKELKGNPVVFVDDNIIGHPSYSRKLFAALAPLGITWIGQSSLNIAHDRELMMAARESGCKGLFIGFESLSDENLREVGKPKINRAEEYAELIGRLHNIGIGIEGAFIFGFDSDDHTVFEKTVDFAERNRLEAVQFGILTPFPGTALRERLLSEDRIISNDWSKYTISYPLYKPKILTVEELYEGFKWAYSRFFSWRSIARRLISLRNFREALQFWLPINLAFREVVKGLQRRGSLPTVPGLVGEQDEVPLV